ncbi:hypothetical protein NDU88_006100 [Pleurodeles waltl]|uniref:Uncharacterized protein n=1 Tax=Pleurodeles waltl TaxID=8319 RepID=A0AAV7SNL9_PLEWA|nr:hypothetical protein NDU88_006100 [Pleurodeles waltl]
MPTAALRDLRALEDSLQHKDKTIYPLFAPTSSHAHPKLTTKDNDKDSEQLSNPSGGERGMLPTCTATIPGSAMIDNYGLVSDLIPSKGGAAKDPNRAISSSSSAITLNPPCTNSIEDWMRQILEELQAIKLSQEEAHKET